VERMPEQDPAGNCVTARTFETHLRWLARRGYRSMTVSELVRSAQHDRGQSGLRVAITFDDGYEDNLIHALPLLERFGFTATVFVITDVIGSHNHFDSHLGGEPVRMLSAAQVRSLADAGLEIGSHTCTHPHSLPHLVGSALDDQLLRSRSVLEGILGRPVRSFSYPHSRVDSRVERAVAEAGYDAACAGTGTRFTPFHLSRVAPPLAHGPALELNMGWRWLKHSVARRRSTASRARDRVLSD
jgi:peptidoglycan/xylan/chitin deacetylase (PgdA/CDA1 family)